MTATLAVEILIRQKRSVIFDVLQDIRGYGEWLPNSIVFRGTSSISEGPIRVGTTYVETSLWGTRQGIVTELDRPRCLQYHQPMTLRPAWLGVIDVRIQDTLTEEDNFTHLTRALTLGFQGPVRNLKTTVAISFRMEIERMQARLKQYAESLPLTEGLT